MLLRTNRPGPVDRSRAWVGRLLVCSRGAACRNPPRYIELFSDVQRATTLVPTAPMTAMAATTIRPAIRAYSSTSPPCSSLTSFANRFLIAFIWISRKATDDPRDAADRSADNPDSSGEVHRPIGSCRRVQSRFIGTKRRSHDRQSPDLRN